MLTSLTCRLLVTVLFWLTPLARSSTPKERNDTRAPARGGDRSPQEPEAEDDRLQRAVLVPLARHLPPKALRGHRIVTPGTLLPWRDFVATILTCQRRSHLASTAFQRGHS